MQQRLFVEGLPEVGEGGVLGDPGRVQAAQLARRFERGGDQPEEREGQEDEVGEQRGVLADAGRCAGPHASSPPLRRPARKTARAIEITATITQPIAAA
ncbi:hypothetical protein SAFG77S_00825 [Streptomyces afghaniensis]